MRRDDQENDDHRKPTHDGSRGVAFRTFRRDFLALARGRFAKDDRYSYYQAFLRMDEGGTGNGAPAMPAAQGGAGGGANPAHAAATTKRSIRQGQAFHFLYEAITDENLREMLSALADGAPAELAGDAWALIVRECDEPSDDLELSRMDFTWNDTNILNTVGYSESTITDYARELNNINTRRPQHARKTENEKAVKFLSSINYPESLAKDAFKELRAEGAKREFRRGAQHDRDFVPLVQNFDNLWRALFRTGTITARAAQRGQRHDTALLHEHESAETEPDPDGEVYLVTMDDGDSIFYAGTRRNFNNRPGAQRNGPRPVRFQRVCRNCWGMDHHDSVCPSPKQDRDIADVMVHARIKRAIGPGAENRNVERDGVAPRPPALPRTRPFRPARRAPGGRASINVHTAEQDNEDKSLANRGARGR